MISIEKLERDLLYNSNDPILINGFPVYPVPIRTIRRIGYTTYRTLLGILCITPENISAMLEDPAVEGVPLYFLVTILEYQKQQREDILDAFRLICREDISWNAEKMEIYCSGGTLDRTNFSDFQSVVKKRNKIGDSSEDDNPADERTRALLARSRELEAKRAKARGDDEGVTLADLISICAAKLQIHPDCVGDYDMYQLNDMLGRYKIFDDYETNINALLHGAKKEDVDLHHWISGNQDLFK